ncbi:hypothetical protein OG474_13490 [Kribbella sp. NBC_01505]|uniref:hypothetical protein n=1 Tax=Kribbella sp. NBC_01505 TaxID=2903580 RepID=UPI003863C9D8
MDISAEVERTVAAFVEPKGYRQPADAFNDGRQALVVLRGARGSGRRASALSLLARSGDGVTECSQDWITGPQVPLLPRAQDGRYLLDLTGEEDVPATFGSHLGSYSDVLAGRDARMVILVTPELWRSCERHCHTFTFDLETPEPEAVLVAHLGQSAEHLRWYQEEPALRALVGETSHVRAEELARIITGTAELNAAGASRVADAFNHWLGYLVEHLGPTVSESEVAQAAKMRERATLIAAAVLDGSPIGAVLAAADELLHELGEAPSYREILLGDGVTSRFEKLEIETSQGKVDLMGRHPGLDRALLAWLWTQRLPMRPRIQRWIERITVDSKIAAGQLARVADALVGLAIDQRSLEILGTVEAWVQSGAQHRRLAVSVLERLAVDPEIGSEVRRRLRNWAINKTTGPELLEAVTSVCGGLLGQMNTPAALARLKLLLGRPEAAVRRGASDALQSLADEPAMAKVVATTMSKWSEDAEDHAAHQAVLSLADPGEENRRARQIDALLRDPVRCATLQRSWSAQLTAGNSDAVDLLRRWLACVDAKVLDREVVIAALKPVAGSLRGEPFKDLFMTRRDLSAQEELFRELYAPRPQQVDN